MSSQGVCYPSSMIAGSFFNVKSNMNTIVYGRCFQKNDGIYTLVYLGEASKTNGGAIKNTFLNASIRPVSNN